eukprot:TRINITY_DN11145_c0_g1_i1.p1 TRINITY_DN11145_c0_g1~~TRINITY_DN11145_c0_g1_i1.p1  ORF type:complete len:900 (+),score=195.99 TRINITY_DN11145_c0_g1_i1:145-2844(+)
MSDCPASDDESPTSLPGYTYPQGMLDDAVQAWKIDAHPRTEKLKRQEQPPEQQQSPDDILEPWDLCPARGELMPPLCMAVRCMNHDYVERILEACKEGGDAAVALRGTGSGQVAEPDKHGCFAIHHAARTDCKECVRRLHRFGFNISQPTLQGDWTPLHVTARHGCIRAMTELLRLGARIDAAAAAGVTPLGLACIYNQPYLVMVLMSAYSRCALNPFTEDKYGLSAALAGHMAGTPAMLTVASAQRYGVCLWRDLQVPQGAFHGREVPVGVGVAPQMHRPVPLPQVGAVKSAAKRKCPGKYYVTSDTTPLVAGWYERGPAALAAGEDSGIAAGKPTWRGPPVEQQDRVARYVLYQTRDGRWMIGSEAESVAGKGVVVSGAPSGEAQWPHECTEWHRLLDGRWWPAKELRVRLAPDLPPELETLPGAARMAKGRYKQAPEAFRGFPMWVREDGKSAIYHDNSHLWRIGPRAKVTENAGWMRTAQPHGGRAPCDLEDWMVYRGNEGWAPYSGSPVRVPEERPEEPEDFTDAGLCAASLAAVSASATVRAIATRRWRLRCRRAAQTAVVAATGVVIARAGVYAKKAAADRARTQTAQRQMARVAALASVGALLTISAALCRRSAAARAKAKAAAKVAAQAAQAGRRAALQGDAAAGGIGAALVVAAAAVWQPLSAAVSTGLARAEDGRRRQLEAARRYDLWVLGERLGRGPEPYAVTVVGRGSMTLSSRPADPDDLRAAWHSAGGERLQGDGDLLWWDDGAGRWRLLLSLTDVPGDRVCLAQPLPPGPWYNCDPPPPTAAELGWRSARSEDIAHPTEGAELQAVDEGGVWWPVQAAGPLCQRGDAFEADVLLLKGARRWGRVSVHNTQVRDAPKELRAQRLRAPRLKALCALPGVLVSETR